MHALLTAVILKTMMSQTFRKILEPNADSEAARRFERRRRCFAYAAEPNTDCQACGTQGKMDQKKRMQVSRGGTFGKVVDGDREHEQQNASPALVLLVLLFRLFALRRCDNTHS